MTHEEDANQGSPLSRTCDRTGADAGRGRLHAPVELAKREVELCSECLATFCRKEKQVTRRPKAKSVVVRLKQLIRAASAAGINVNFVECLPDGTIRVASDKSRVGSNDLFTRLQDQL